MDLDRYGLHIMQWQESNFLVNQSKLHYVVDIDIKGFFDNINHTLLIKQLWNLGIQRQASPCLYIQNAKS